MNTIEDSYSITGAIKQSKIANISCQYNNSNVDGTKFEVYLNTIRHLGIPTRFPQVLTLQDCLDH